MYIEEECKCYCHNIRNENVESISENKIDDTLLTKYSFFVDQEKQVEEAAEQENLGVPTIKYGMALITAIITVLGMALLVSRTKNMAQKSSFKGLNLQAEVHAEALPVGIV